MAVRRTKIIATLGPASSRTGVLARLIESGVNIVRFNFSHGTHQTHEELLQAVRTASSQVGRPISLLLDLQGPKIRVGEFPGNGIFLEKGQKISITTKTVVGSESTIPINYPDLPGDVHKGDRILLDDGLLELVVEGGSGTEVVCRVRVGGVLSSRKGVNLPGIPVRLPSLTEKDRRDLTFALRNGFHFIALSFVRQAGDMLALKEEIRRRNGRAFVIAKIEKPEAWDQIDAIIAASDGLMVARGDLGVEIGPEKVPIIQKEIVRWGRSANKPVIIATQMLESMRTTPRPTRAEASDVANAIFDGADAVMLSGETSVGQYPIESVRMMDKIIRQIEKTMLARKDLETEHLSPGASFPDAISAAACKAALELRAKAIVAFTQSGFTAKLISKYRPKSPIYAFTPNPRVERELELYWGVSSHTMEVVQTVDEMIGYVDRRLVAENVLRPGDTIAILAGAPVGVPGTTNMLTLHRIAG